MYELFDSRNLFSWLETCTYDFIIMSLLTMDQGKKSNTFHVAYYQTVDGRA